jgi:phosphohistidine phosphatase
MISLYILRHGEAEMASHNDSDRRLTEKGRLQVRQSGQLLPEIDLMVVSPYVRAQESAREIAAILAGKGLEIGREHNSETLVPDSSTNAVTGWLEDVDANRVLLVSHNPLVTALVDLLTGGDTVYFGTGTLVHIRGDLIAPGCMSVVPTL